MDLFDPVQMILKRLLERLREHGPAILCAFPIPNRDFVARKVYILDPQAQTLQEPQTRAIHQACHQPLVAVELIQDGFDFLARHHDRQTLGFPRPDDITKIPHLAPDDMPIEEEQRA